MSGGSFDYLCFKQFLQHEDMLRAMADCQIAMGYRTAADET